MSKIGNYLKQIDDVIKEGPYAATWASLSNYEAAKWYKDAKFGIFTHWGPYSVPAFGSEWYARQMYLKGTPEYEHHIKTYGAHKDFGYADFIPMFKAEKFNAEEWLDLFVASGAKYYMPVAEHHDGFQMYDSDLSDWNAKKMGPMRDVLGELKAATEERGLVFCVSNHRAENYWFMSGLRDFDSGLQDIEYQEPYGYAVKLFEPDEQETTSEIHSAGPSKEHLEDWLARICELVEKYQPSVIWFDWWIQNKAFKPYLKKFAAYYYNSAIKWGKEVAINYKDGAFAHGTAIFDIERGSLSEIRPNFWQTDTAVALNSWCYTEGNKYKTPESLVCDLIDIVSKNGSMLLNIGPKADGTIPKEDADILRSIGQWLEVNGESIYDTTYWSTYGEGPTHIIEGTFNDVKRLEFTSEDVRFTYNAPYVYANVLKCPEDQQLTIKSLKKIGKFFRGDVVSAEILGFDVNVVTVQGEQGLTLTLDKQISTTYPVCFKIKID